MRAHSPNAKNPSHFLKMSQSRDVELDDDEEESSDEEAPILESKKRAYSSSGASRNNTQASSLDVALDGLTLESKSFLSFTNDSTEYQKQLRSQFSSIIDEKLKKNFLPVPKELKQEFMQ